MLSDFLSAKQPMELDCLPTCVQAVFQYQFNQSVSIEQARELCDAEPMGGCIWSNSIRALRAADYWANEVTNGNETDDEALGRLYDLVEISGLPVIVQIPIQVTATGRSLFHALVVVSVAEDGDSVTVMNPDKADGFEQWAGKTFVGTWAITDFNGFYFADEETD